MQNIIIIGNGIAGITAARHIRKLSNHKITVISGETEYFFSRTALMYIYMGHLTFDHTKPYSDDFWDKNQIELIQAWVKSIDTNSKSLLLHSGGSISYDQLILATGSNSNTFGWTGEKLKGVQGLYSYQDLLLMEENTRNVQHAVIVGGGLIGVEMAEMLHSRHIKVTYLVREENFWGNVLPQNEARIIDHHLLEHGIELITHTEVSEMLDDGHGHIKGVKTKAGELIECQFLGLTIGVHANLSLVNNTPIETARGILVDDYLQTNIEGIYAIGDCAELRNPLPHRRATEAVWYAGRMMGETVARTLTGTKTAYKPGIWFNSAKFFDIEYQTYGNVPAVTPNGSGSFYWENHEKNKCIRIVYDQQSMAVTGVNLLGIRNRHEVWDQWIEDKKPLQQVVGSLRKANFDPEFFKRWEPQIQEQYNREFPDQPVKVGRRGAFDRIFA